MGSPIVELGLSCPGSGSFYICTNQATRFVGCCTIDPCTTHDGLCPDDDLQPSSFSPAAYDKILAQECLDPGFLWYTCAESSPPFLGCCSQNACSPTGCPADKVGAASLSGNPKQAAPFLDSDSSTTSGASSSTTSSIASSTASNTATSTTGSPTASSQPPAGPPSAHTSTGLSKGAIAGIAVAAAAGACILALVAFWLLRRKRRQPIMAAGGSGSSKSRMDEFREDAHVYGVSHRLLGGRMRSGDNAMTEQMAELPPSETSPGLKSPAISELPATPSQQSITSSATPATKHIASMASSNGMNGRESAISGLTASAQPSPLVQQSLFELEDSSSRTFVGR